MNSGYEMTSLDLQRVNGITARSSKHSRLYQIDAKYVLDTDQAQPLRVLYGRDYVSALQMMPCYDLETHGGGNDKDGYEQSTYTAGVVVALCCGVVNKILKIDNSNDTIWSGDFALGPNGAAYNMSYKYNTLTTDSGSLRVYAGTLDQEIDPALTRMEVVDDGGTVLDMEHGAYRGCAYMVGENFNLGTQNVMNNLRVECVRIPHTLEENCPAGYVYPWTEDPDVVEFPHATVDGDMYLPEIVYDLLVNTLYGAGLSPDQIDYDSFCRAQYQCFRDGIAVSGCVDESAEFLEILSQLLEYVDGLLTWKNGKIFLKLLRWDDGLRTRMNAVYPDLGPGIHTPVAYPDFMLWNLAEEPEVKIQQNDCWNVTSVTFNDRTASYESTSESYECPFARRSAADEIVTKEVARPWVKTRAVAAKLARRLGVAGVFPGIEITCKTIQPIENASVGDLANIGYDRIPLLALGAEEANSWCNRPHPLLRIMEISYPEPDSHIVTYICRLHRNLDPDMDVAVTNTPALSGSLIPTLEKAGGWLHPHLLLISPTAAAVFCSKPAGAAMTGYHIEATSASAGGQYWQAGSSQFFQVPGTLLSWTTNAAGICFRIVVPKTQNGGVPTGYVDAISLLLNQKYFYLFTAAQRDNGSGYSQTGQWMCLKSVDFNDSGIPYGSYSPDAYYVFEVTCLGGEQGSISPGITGEDSWMPSQTVFLCAPKGYFIYGTSNGLGQYFGIKAIADFGHRYGPEPSSQVIPTTASITSGVTTFSPVSCDWGSAVLPDAGSSAVVSAAGVPSEDEPDGTLYRDTQTGTVYLASDGDWEEFGQTDPGEDSVGSGSTYFKSFSASSAFTHQTGCNGMIIVHIPNETPITLTLPSAASADPGDMITIVCTKGALVAQNTITLQSTGSLISSAATESPLQTSVGLVTRLICNADHVWILSRNQMI